MLLSKLQKKFIYFSITTILFVFMFKNTLRTLYYPLQTFPLIILSSFIFLFILNILNKGAIYRNTLFIFIFILYFFILVLLFKFLTIKYNVYIPLLGLLQYLFPILFWTLIFNNIRNKKLILNYILYIILLIGIINAIGGIIQYFISSNLFGLISNHMYVDIKEHVTKRAISFISSPQSLGLFMGLSFGLSYFFITNNIMKLLLMLLFLFAGILTGSKIFILYIAIFFLLSNMKKPIYIFSFFIIIGIFIVYLGSTNDTFKRYIMLFNTLSNLSDYATLLIWINFLTYDASLLQILFGHGLGVITTAAQTVYDYKIMNGSAESFIVQLYFETGIIGVFLFLYLYIKSIYNYIVYGYNYISYILIALIISLIGTPAFFGFFISLVYYSLIIYGFLLKKGDE